MDFLKKNYEKVLLGVVLLSLAVAVAFLPFKITSEKQKLEDMRNTLIHPNVKPLTNLDLAGPESLLKRMAAPAVIDFSVPHKLLNPMPWQKAADGRLIKVDTANIGPNALTVTKRTPLYLILSLDDVSITDSGARYRIGVEKQAAANSKEWAKKQKNCKLGDKNETFTLRDVKALPDSPTNATVTIELNDTSEQVKVTKEKPYKRVDGYTVDLKYPPENKLFPTGRRVGAALSFNGEDYNIVASTATEVVLLAKSNQKKWTVKYSAAP